MGNKNVINGTTRNTNGTNTNGTNTNGTNNQKVKVGWESHSSDVFIYSGLHGLEPLDLGVLSHQDRLAEVAGYRRRYVSRTGLTGEGILTDTTNLLKVGQYGTGGYLDDVHIPEEVAPGVSVMLPRLSSRANEVLEKSPVVIKINDGWGTPVIIYTLWGESFEPTLKKVLRGEELPEGKLLKKTFTVTACTGYNYPGKRVDREVRFINLFGGFVPGLNPWKFLTEELEDSWVATPRELPWQIAGVAKLPSGQLVRTVRIEHKLYATEVISEDPCLAMTEPPAGWNLAARNLVFRESGNEVQVVAWLPTEGGFLKVLKRMIGTMPTEDGMRFVEYLQNTLAGEYPHYDVNELRVPKALFLLAREEILAEVRRELAAELRRNFSYWMESWKETSGMKA